MYAEPKELRLPTARTLANTKAAAVDEAFASVTHADLRVDSATASDTEQQDRTIAPELIESLRSQLSAIELQRGTLKRLLDDLNG